MENNKKSKLIVLGNPQGGGGTQVQSDWTENNTSSPAYIKNKPTISNAEIIIKQNNVTKGSFTLNQNGDATINLEGGGGGGSTQVQSNWAETDTEAVSFIQNKPTLATVATSGNYEDLTNKPSIPSSTDFVVVGNTNQNINGTKTFLHPINITSGDRNSRMNTKLTAITIGTAPQYSYIGGISFNDNNDGNFCKIEGGYTVNGSIEADFNLDNLDGVTAKLGISIDSSGNVSTVAPTPATSDNSTKIATTAFVKGQGYAVASSLATVATSGSYSDLTNKPTIPAAQVNSDWNAVSGVSQILNKPNMGTETLTFVDANNVETTVVVYTQPTV